MNREVIREKTMQLIFQMDINGEFDYTRLTPVEENLNIMNKPQAVAALDAIRDHIGEIDAMISSNLDKWTLDRVAKADLAILRTAVAEMMYVDSIPRKVSINEAVKLSRKFGDSKSYAFVNSVLSKVDKCLEDK
ncbi:MAG: transcription antitermination factor NusB [Mogibacterium sp.]|jgi:N utilization substance protein B|nr:transcription antitermination factor NusB [Mogibacterium sp.]